MLGKASSATLSGVNAVPVDVEVAVHEGPHQVQVVGLPESAARETRERVHAAIRNCDLSLTNSVVVNLSPGDLRKEAAHLDLAIAMAILVACEHLPQSALQGRLLCGELALDGAARAIRGGLAIAELAHRLGVRELLLPAASAREAALLGCSRTVPLQGLTEALQHLLGSHPISPLGPAAALPLDFPEASPDLAEIRGHEVARRALEVAAAGGHSLLLLGPPGSGKTMLARRLPGILPPLTLAESITATRIHSLVAEAPCGDLLRLRPFRAPHATASLAGLVGGGPYSRPGEASLAHHGILFLDDLPEFPRHHLEALRPALEQGSVTVFKAGSLLHFPACFTLVAGMNPCPYRPLGRSTPRLPLLLDCIGVLVEVSAVILPTARGVSRRGTGFHR